VSVLRQMYPRYSLGYYCRLFGKSRQSWYEQQNKADDQDMAEALVIKLVKEIRAGLPRCGVAKLYFLLQDKLKEHQIKLGRDALYALLREHGYLIRQRRRKPYTTDSNHPWRKYPNLIRDLVIERPNQLWVSDITYLSIGTGFGYLSIVTDAYSRKIVGHHLHPSLHSEGPMEALVQAERQRKSRQSLIHHSDRGTQYCSQEYVKILNGFHIQISMTENGDPYENALAERINGILKMEFGLADRFPNLEQARQKVQQAVAQYNHARPHASVDYLTPEQAHGRTGHIPKRWKPKPKPEIQTAL
jgi:putative transposase